MQKKIDREFLLTDESVNCYGFRLMTSGYMKERYLSNPIGYRQHKREDGVVLKWEDIRIANGSVFGKPTINLSNPLGQQTADEVENGFLNAASVGGIVVVEFSDAPELMHPGQTGPTVTKWYNKEISLVDVPGNPNATVQLFDEQDNEINLTDFIHNTLKKQSLDFLKGFNSKLNTPDMELKAILISALSLADNATDEAIGIRLKDLVSKEAQLTTVQTDLANAKLAETTATKALNDYKVAQMAIEVKDLVDAGTAAGKITAQVGADLAAKYADDAAGLKKVIDGLPVYKTVAERIAEGAGAVKNLADQTWDQLDKAGKLAEYKAADLEGFKAKHKETFGTDYV